MNLPIKRADWPATWRELFEERAGMMEFLGGMDRRTSEILAEQDIRKLAAQEREEHSA